MHSWNSNQRLTGIPSYLTLSHPLQAVTVVVAALDGHPHGTVFVFGRIYWGHACTFLKQWGASTVDVTVGQAFAAVALVDGTKLVERVFAGETTSSGIRVRERGRMLGGGSVLV